MVEVKPKKAPTKGPQVTVRMRSKKEMELVRRAARLCNLSINTFAVDVLTQGAESVIKVHGAPEVPATT